MMEQWRDIEGYEGLYQVSDKGNVRSLDRTVEYTHHISNTVHNKQLRGKVLSQGLVRGYLTTGLYKNGVSKSYRVNRLVAVAFIPNPNNLPQVGHDDDVRINNTVSNLYWTDAKENANHNDKPIRSQDKCIKPIIGVKDNEVITFKSSKEAERKGFNASAIRNCLIGLSKTHKGYTWQHVS